MKRFFASVAYAVAARHHHACPFVFHPNAIVRVMKRNKKRSITVVIFCSQIKREVFYVAGIDLMARMSVKWFFMIEMTHDRSRYPLTTQKLIICHKNYPENCVNKILQKTVNGSCKLGLKIYWHERFIEMLTRWSWERVRTAEFH